MRSVSKRFHALLRVYSEGIFARSEYAAFEDHVQRVLGKGTKEGGSERLEAGAI
jgi:hypothetical protein